MNDTANLDGFNCFLVQQKAKDRPCGGPLYEYRVLPLECQQNVLIVPPS
jgi:hypothetical protein